MEHGEGSSCRLPVRQRLLQRPFDIVTAELEQRHQQLGLLIYVLYERHFADYDYDYDYCSSLFTKQSGTEH